MSNNFLQRIKTLSLEELVKELFSLKRELFSLRFQKVMKEITDTSRFRIIKKNIARISTEFHIRKYNEKTYQK